MKERINLKYKTMGNEVKDYKSKPPSIKGVTTINHALRVEMGLGPMEYGLKIIKSLLQM